eukprot:365855-Chlamydomonas_euryale.AAC.9
MNFGSLTLSACHTAHSAFPHWQYTMPRSHATGLTLRDVRCPGGAEQRGRGRRVEGLRQAKGEGGACGWRGRGVGRVLVGRRPMQPGPRGSTALGRPTGRLGKPALVAARTHMGSQALWRDANDKGSQPLWQRKRIREARPYGATQMTGKPATTTTQTHKGSQALWRDAKDKGSQPLWQRKRIREARPYGATQMTREASHYGNANA